jgi:hypothetical protein
VDDLIEKHFKEQRTLLDSVKGVRADRDLSHPADRIVSQGGS